MLDIGSRQWIRFRPPIVEKELRMIETAQDLADYLASNLEQKAKDFRIEVSQ